MLLTPQQLQEIKQIIQDYHDAFIANAISPSALTPEALQRLKDAGLIDPQINSIEDSYMLGQLAGHLESNVINSMTFDEFKQYLRKNPIPLSPAEHQAVQMAIANAAQYTKGLGNVVSLRSGGVMIEADRMLRAQTEAGIQDATAMNIAKRQTVKQLKTDLGWMAKDFARDWSRIAITEKHAAMQQGLGDYYRKRYGKDTLVAKRTMPDACKHCKRLFDGPDGQPRIFKLSTLEANGTNVGRKAADWLPVLGPVHPNCQCQLIRVPAGWGFNEEGQLDPDGKLGVRYEDEADLTMALVQENDLHKAFQLQGRLDFQGLDIAIENKAGSTRRWTAADGSTGSNVMTYAYGYIQNTQGADEDEIDCFIGPDPRSQNVYVIEQQDPNTGRFDEQKCMLGFANEMDAQRAYRENYDIPEDYLVTCVPMRMDQFKRWIKVTEPQTGEMAKSDQPRLVIPVEPKGKRLIDMPEFQGETEFSRELARSLSADFGASTSQAGNRAVVDGSGMANVISLFPDKKKARRKSDNATGLDVKKTDLSEDDDEEGKDRQDNRRRSLMKRKETYIFQEPHPDPRKPFNKPEDWDAGEQAREGHERRKAAVMGTYERNRKPVNRAEVARKSRRPVPPPRES